MDQLSNADFYLQHYASGWIITTTHHHLLVRLINGNLTLTLSQLEHKILMYLPYVASLARAAALFYPGNLSFSHLYEE